MPTLNDALLSDGPITPSIDTTTTPQSNSQSAYIAVKKMDSPLYSPDHAKSLSSKSGSRIHQGIQSPEVNTVPSDDANDSINARKDFLSKLKGAEIVTSGCYTTSYTGLSSDERDIIHEKKLDEDIIVVEGLTKEFALEGREETVQALSEVSLVGGSEIYPIKRGEFVFIRGPSGGGKTTFLNLLGTIDSPSRGKITIFGDEINPQCSDQFLSNLRLRKIGFIFQTFNLISTLSAYENVALPLVINQSYNKLTDAEIQERAIAMLTLVGLQDRLGHLSSELSGGEQQRVTIARSLVNLPQVLLMDEPTAALDSLNTIEIMNLILKINRERGVTCVMVTHNPDLECYADRILYVENGIFKRQAINMRQMALEYEPYMQHLNKLSKLH